MNPFAPEKPKPMSAGGQRDRFDPVALKNEGLRMANLAPIPGGPDRRTATAAHPKGKKQQHIRL